jgi:predicted dehydrogenase
LVKDQVGIGIIGTGTIAQSHLQSLKGFEQARVVGVFDVLADRAESTARTWGIPNVVTRLDDLLALPDLDAVIVCTPPFAHAEPTLAALEAGKHVLCEKPFALDPAEAERMVETAERAGKFLACCSARNRYTPSQQRAHAILEKGELGDVYHVRYSEYRFRGRPGDHIFPQSAWFLDRVRAGGGAMMDIAVYMIDSTLWLLGNPKVLSVMGQMRQIVEEPPPDGVKQDVEDHVVIMLQCEGGKSGIIETSWVSNMSNADSLLMFGTKAGLRFNPLTIIRPHRVPDEEVPPIPIFGKNMYRPVEESAFPMPGWEGPAGQGDVTRPFVEALLAGRQPMTPARDALEVTRVIDAAYRSAREQRAVVLA